MVYTNRAERRRATAERAQEVTFYCELCGELIGPPRDSQAFAAYLDGQLARENAVALLHGAHDRHLHTNYDQVRRERVVALRGGDTEWSTAHALARKYARTQARV